MKKNVIFLICLITSIGVFGQNETKQINVQVEEVKVTPPKFIGVENASGFYVIGESSLIDNYIAKNFVCPDGVFDYKKEGTEIIRFTVTPDGRLTKFNVINSVCNEIDKELINVLRGTSGMWVPGFNNGEPTAMQQEVSVIVGDYNRDEIVNHFVVQAKKYFEAGSSALLAEHKPKKALKLYNNATQYLPNDKGLLLLRGLCNYELGNKEAARRDWNRILMFGGFDHSDFFADLDEMKGYKEMTRILAREDKN
jgi:hypothetical protein